MARRSKQPTIDYNGACGSHVEHVNRAFDNENSMMLTIRTWEQGQRTDSLQCSNNLRQVALALQSYHWAEINNYHAD